MSEVSFSSPYTLDLKIYPDPNPALAEVLVSREVRRAVEERAHTAALLYQAKVAKRTGRLAASAHASTEMAQVLKGQARWIGVLTVGGRGVDYAAAHEFGTHEGAPTESGRFGTHETVGAEDLNSVLQELAAY